MFINNFIKICNARNVSPSRVCHAIGLSNATFTSWNNGSVPRMSTLVKISDYFNISVDELLADSDEPHEPPHKGVKIPVLGKVVAGIPLEAIEEILDWEYIPEEMAKADEYFSLIVSGDSMEPTINPGDTVICRRQDTADSGDIVVVLIGSNDATIKKIRVSANSISLIPLNPKYDVMSYSKQQIADLPVMIFGKVVELRRKL